jgi:hypothetical protein
VGRRQMGGHEEVSMAGTGKSQDRPAVGGSTTGRAFPLGAPASRRRVLSSQTARLAGETPALPGSIVTNFRSTSTRNRTII